MKRTPLFEKHVEAGARMVEFGGWEMPVAYSDITSEHKTVRGGVGLFDLCHMGRVSVRGPQAAELVQGAQTNDLDRIKPGRIRYAMLLQDDGCVIDDILVHRREEDIFIVVNASNRETDVARLRELGAGLDAEVVDLSDEMGMIALQGPRSAAVVAKLCEGVDVDAIPYYGLAEGKIVGAAGMITRTGYTGEDGFELYLPNDRVVAAWDAAIEAGVSEDLQLCGLGCRDTLRLEAGMPLYGHEITETINPLEAGLNFGVRLKKPDYPGREALAKVKAEGPARRLIGLKIEGRRIPRQGYPVLINGEAAGVVASGTWSPTFDLAIATALVDSAALESVSKIEVDVRGRPVQASIVDIPFYKRDGSGSLNPKT